MSALSTRPAVVLGVLAVLAGLFVLARVVEVVDGWRGGARDLVGVLGVAVAAAGLSRASLPAQLLAGVVLLAGGAVVVWHRRTRSAAVVGRWGARSRRKSGVASTVDIARRGSALAMRRNATVVRPSLADRSRLERWRLSTTEVAVPLCRVGALRVWSSVEDVICLFGGPRTGKTGYLAGRVIDAPGAVLVTSTRTDLHELTAALRARRGPVYVFNAVGLGGVPSTITFDPLTGCTDPVTAAERATDCVATDQRPKERSFGETSRGRSRSRSSRFTSLVCDTESSHGEAFTSVRLISSTSHILPTTRSSIHEPL